MDVENELGSLDKCRYALKVMKQRLKRLVDDERTERSRLENYLHMMIEMPRLRAARLTEHNQRNNLEQLIEETRKEGRKVASQRKLLQLLQFCDEVRTEEKQIIRLIKQTDLNLSKERSRIALKCRGRGTQPSLCEPSECKIIRARSQTLKSWSVWSMEEFKCKAEPQRQKQQLRRFLRQKCDDNKKSIPSIVSNLVSNFLPPIKKDPEKILRKVTVTRQTRQKNKQLMIEECCPIAHTKDAIKERLREKLRRNKQNFIS